MSSETPTRGVAVVASLPEGSRFEVHGRLTAAVGFSVRIDDDLAGASFTAPPELGLGDEHTGAWVRAAGFVRGGVATLERLDVLQRAHRPFPVAGGDWRAFHDRARTRLNGLRTRAAVVRSIRRWFESEDFLDVETPLAVPSPGLDLHLAPFEVLGMRDDVGPARRWLITSPEYQMKRLLAAGLPRIVQLAKCFRREERGHLHQPEFTMLEWYRAFCGSDAVMADTERLVERAALELHGTTRFGTLDRDGRPITVDVAAPWTRWSVAEAVELFAGARLDDLLADEDQFFLTWAEQVEPRLGCERPVFIVDWPASMASLARLHDDRPHLADRFEAYVGGIELCNGFGELTDPVEQRARLERDVRERARTGRDALPIDERFLRALEEGLPPCAGNALGVDRLVALLVGARSLDDVVTFGVERL